MSWGQPSALSEFPANSPFLGIPIPKDVRISQQVLAEPTPDLADKTWARLADGTPLVTGEKRGQGYLVLIHTTANTGWSNMALSGLFVNMLQRLVTLSRGVAGDGVNKALKPWRTLDGFGRLGAPPAGAQILPADANETFKPKPTTPPGLYGDENAQVAFNIGGRVGEPKPIVLPGGVVDRPAERRRRDRSLQVVPAGRPAAAAGRHLHLAVDARADGPRLPLCQGTGARRPRRPAAAAGRRRLPAAARTPRPPTSGPARRRSAKSRR